VDQFLIDNRNYVTSEKGVAMLLRWHIWRPGHITNPPIDKYEDGKYVGREKNKNYIYRDIIEQIQKYGSDEKLNDQQKQAREDAILEKIKDASLTYVDKKGNPNSYDIRDIYNLINVPQRPQDIKLQDSSPYKLELGLNKKLSKEYGSFLLQPPEPQPQEKSSQK
jgi:hypothetical protein